VPLAGDHDDVGGTRQQNRTLDRTGPVELDMPLRPRCGDSSDDL
jgi:hypothetical protein